ncbi:GNAT family N-acetyltransferase [Mesorhizobium sp. AR10]|uniref:GNAT family N-acetyltransferase n=1 Tax=Mesorhizobium sp. AR10 TaxID=2865839 RepID=UPI00215E8852|nr:GNAT family N-acetyltransferase [Mesorhizobium sp. AR10]UVK37855.1 GNAT family N-acetyltransferase [Mesorhizobium sp. AR10]
MLDKVALTIRPATGDQHPDLSDIIAAAFETYRGAIPDRALFKYIANSTNLGQHKGRGDIMVLESAGRIIGSVTYYPKAGDEGLGLPGAGIRTLVVHPAARGCGFGRSLVEHCVERARRQGAATLGLHTADFMKHAVALYRTIGFQRCPQYDLRASDILGIDLAGRDIQVTAYQLKL